MFVKNIVINLVETSVAINSLYILLNVEKDSIFCLVGIFTIFVGVMNVVSLNQKQKRNNVLLQVSQNENENSDKNYSKDTVIKHESSFNLSFAKFSVNLILFLLAWSNSPQEKIVYLGRIQAFQNFALNWK